jgi:polyvinyl alcohol dehydrogenase (cytochrome)
MKRVRKHHREKIKQQNLFQLMAISILALLLSACSFPVSTLQAVPIKALEILRSAQHDIRPVPIPGISTTLQPGDWSTYLFNNQHTGYNATETIINSNTAPRLKLHWMYHAKGAISTQPVEAYGMVFWGSWDGLEHATDLNGHEVWSVNLGTTRYKDCNPTVGVASTATVAPITINGITTQVVFVGGGNAHFYALNASNGHILWQVVLGSSPANFIWASPILYNGSVYAAVSSYGDCPLVQGKLFRLDAASGAIQNVFDAVPNGCLGAGIWSTPAIDASTNELFLATSASSPPSCPHRKEIYSFAVVQLRASDLTPLSYWRIPVSERLADGDFGASPTLFTATIGGTLQNLIGLAHKNGIYYALDRAAINKGAVWKFKVARGGSSPENGEGSISPSAWDGTRVYIAGGKTKIRGVKCQGNVGAFNPATGIVLWQKCLQEGPVLAAITTVPGLVVVEEGHHLDVLNATTGKTLFSYEDSDDSNFEGSASISHGVLYVGNMDGTLFAFGL